MPSNLRVFVCIEVFEHEKPILLVTRVETGFAFLCGDMHPDSADHFRAVGIGHVFDDDPSLPDPSDLALFEEYERQDSRSPWMRQAGTTD